MGDPVVEEGRRWRELWIHYEAEELRVRYRDTIPSEAARRVIMDLLASGRVPPIPETVPDHRSRRVRPIL